MTGLAYAAAQDCRVDQKPGASKRKPFGTAPRAGCDNGQTGVSTGQMVSQPRSTAGQRPTSTDFTTQAAAKPSLVYVVDFSCCDQ